METTKQFVEVPWLVMDNGIRLYAHVIGLKSFTAPRAEDSKKTENQIN